MSQYDPSPQQPIYEPEPLGADIVAENLFGELADRVWQWWLVRGIIVALFGVFALVWPQTAIGAFVIFLGILWVVEAIVTLVSAFGTPGIPGRVWAIISGIIGLVAGVVLISSPAASAAVLVWLVGIFAIIAGIVTVVEAFVLRGAPGWGWLLVAGLSQAILGVVIVAWPGITAVVLAIIVGIWALLFGVWLIVFSLWLRKVGRELAPIQG